MAGTLAAGDKVADFILPALDGGDFNSLNARGRGLLMFAFWKKGCGTCRYAMPFLQRFHENYAEEGSFQIWGVSQDNADDTHAFTEEFSITFPQALDIDLDVTYAYGLVTVPGIYLVDASDRVLQNAPAFVADEFNAMAKLIAQRQGKEYIPIVLPEDDAPAIKPG